MRTTTVTNTRPAQERGQKIRLSLDISPALNDLLERLAADTGASKSDVLRKAIALMEVAAEAKRRGQKFGIANQDQQLATEIIGV